MLKEEFDTIQIATAEGAYAAKAFCTLDQNPYDRDYAGLYAAWENGFINELVMMRNDLKVTKQYVGKQHEEIRSLKRRIAELELELAETVEEMMSL